MSICMSHTGNDHGTRQRRCHAELLGGLLTPFSSESISSTTLGGEDEQSWFCNFWAKTALWAFVCHGVSVELDQTQVQKSAC